jgi:hypothetical protein
MRSVHAHSVPRPVTQAACHSVKFGHAEHARKRSRQPQRAPCRVNMDAGNSTGDVEQQVVNRDAGAQAAGHQPIEAAADIDVNPGSVRRDLSAGPWARPLPRPLPLRTPYGR